MTDFFEFLRTPVDSEQEFEVDETLNESFRSISENENGKSENQEEITEQQEKRKRGNKKDDFDYDEYIKQEMD